MTGMPRERVSPDRLLEIEAAFTAAWTGRGSTPFLVDIQPSSALLEDARRAARTIPATTLLSRFPTLGVWAVLQPLARNYGVSSAEVYTHIGAFLSQDFPAGPEREALKRQYRISARKIGLPVSGNRPTDLFFAPLGPPAARHPELAGAFMDMALRRGPPAIEDTTAARSWQRLAVEWKCQGLTRLLATIAFDTSAHCAKKFEAWRQGQDPIGDLETSLFDAYTRAAGLYGRTRESIVGPPAVVWHNDRLALEAEKATVAQDIFVSAFPTRLAPGKRHRLPPPWPIEIDWRAGPTRRPVAFAPKPGEFLVFDADSGACLARQGIADGHINAAAQHLVILSPEPLTASRFGASAPAQDKSYHVAWIDLGEDVVFSSGGTQTITAPVETAAWIDAPVLGRAGSRVLYASDGVLHLRLDASIGGAARTLRIRAGTAVHYRTLDIPQAGTLAIAFSDLGLDAPRDPANVIFEVLAPGASGDLDARSELTTSCWVWPGLTALEGDLEDIPLPSNIDPARSAGLRLLDGLLSVDPRSDAEVPILGLRDQGTTHEFHLAARAEKLWHCRIAAEDRVYVPRGEQLVFGRENRHDTLLLRSPDREADLLVLGRRFRRPFRNRQQIEIGAEKLERTGDDDRIALQRPDGRVDILAHLRRLDAAGELILREGEDEIRLDITLSESARGIVARIHALDGSIVESGHAFDRLPTPVAPHPAIKVSHDNDTRQTRIHLDPATLPAPGWVNFDLLMPSARDPLRDRAGAAVCIGLSGAADTADLAGLTRITAVLAEAEPDSLGGQLRHALQPAYSALHARFGDARMVGRIRSVLSVGRTDGGIPRHDLVGVAPWIFEAPAAALSGLGPASGLSQLSRILATDPELDLPDLRGDAPLLVWLDHLTNGGATAEGLGVEDLQHAMRLLRHRLKDTDLRQLAAGGDMRKNLSLIAGAYTENLDAMRAFDHAGGGDPLPARIAVQIERFARAASLHRTDEFVDDLAFRTGLTRADVGWILTILLRAGVEIFVYFRSLWDYASRRGDLS